MKVVLDFPDLRDDELLARLARRLLETMVDYNRYYIRRFRPPKLYDSGVRFRDEPWAGKLEQFASIPPLLKSGWADCAQLAAWRVAELREMGIRAGFRIYGRFTGKWPRRRRAYHVQVRWPPSAKYPKGWIEDVSRYLEF